MRSRTLRSWVGGSGCRAVDPQLNHVRLTIIDRCGLKVFESAMELHRGMRPMLDFSSLPQRPDERPRRRRRAVKTPKNARVKSVHASLEPNDVVRLATKWVRLF